MSKKAKQWVKAAIITFVIVPLILAPVKLGISVWINHRHYEKVQAFRPTEGLMCQIDLVEKGHHSETKALNLIEQKKLQAAIAKLEYGGYYAVDPLWPFFKNTLYRDSEPYTDASYYVLYMNLGNTSASIRIQKDMCFDWFAQSKYVLKYDNYEALFLCCETFFSESEASN